jgi:hypothetical protein
MKRREPIEHRTAALARLLAKAPARLQINDHIAESVDYPPSADLPRAEDAEAMADQPAEAYCAVGA